jgi:hypothetical protein
MHLFSAIIISFIIEINKGLAVELMENKNVVVNKEILLIIEQFLYLVY